MAVAVFLKDREGNTIYPKVAADSLIDENGVSIIDRLEGAGDMTRAVYDPNNDNEVDVATTARGLTEDATINASQVEGLDDAISNKYEKTGGEITGVVSITDTTAATDTTTGALTVAGGVGISGDIYAERVYGAVWNDYAERRLISEPKDVSISIPGQVFCEVGDGTLCLAYDRALPCAYVYTDTQGFEIGPKDSNTLPIAVSGRVLVSVLGDRNDYKVGQALCSAAGGLACDMTREEIIEHPEAIIGYVSEIPTYDEWNGVYVGNRVWVRI